MECKNSLLKSMKSTLERRQAHSGRRCLTIAPVNSVDFSSNDFLSLAHSPVLRSTFLEELSRAKNVPLGSRGSRLLDGNSTYTEDIERDIAAFHNAPSGLLFNSGFDANSGLFSCIPQPGDVIIYDEHIHASVHEGMRLSRAGTCMSFAHNCTKSFYKVLEDIIERDHLVIRGTRNVLVAVESVYSMDGDTAPIKSILDILEKSLPHGNGHLIVDEAHSTGVYGPSGRGIVCDLGVESRVLARLHTFGKALSSGGAILLCPPTMREYLINYARSLIYTTALGLPTLAMIKSVYTLMRNGGTRQAQERVWYLIRHLDASLQNLPNTPYLQVSQEASKSPIFSLCTPYPRQLAQHCQANGFVVRPIVPPTVPEGGQRVRVCLHSGNTTKQIDDLIQSIAVWLHMVNQEASFPSTREAKL